MLLYITQILYNSYFTIKNKQNNKKGGNLLAWELFGEQRISGAPFAGSFSWH